MKTLEEHRHDAAVERHLSRIADALERLAAAIESAPKPDPPEAYVPGPRIALAASRPDEP